MKSPFLVLALLPAAFAAIVCFLAAFAGPASQRTPPVYLFLPMSFVFAAIAQIHAHRELQTLRQRVLELESFKTSADRRAS